MDEKDELEEWLVGFLDEPEHAYIQKKAQRDYTLRVEARSLPWYALRARRRLLEEARRVWR